TDYLKKSIETNYTKFSNTTKLKKGQTKEDFLEEKREKVKNDFEAKKRMPQGIVQNAIETIREDLGKDEQFASYHLDKKVAAREENPISNIEIWKDVVRDNFESAWRTAKETHDDTDIVGDA
ncbi:hypothetical protein BGX27_007104, partial [Mortierella sp. AM989]